MTSRDHDAPGSLFGADAVGISLENLTKRFPRSSMPAVTSLTLDVPAGSVVVLVGPSGCGKTTTLRMINRLLEPTEGRISIGGIDARSLPAHELRRHIGYVIQQTGLFPHRDIEANIGTVPRLLGWDRRRIRDRVRELVDVVGLDPEMLPRYPPELSGGQQQRVGVARALAADPPVLLMDEPYSAVDPIVRARLQDELLDLQAKVRKTIVVVTHDIDEAIKLGDRIAILELGGLLAQYGTPEELLSAPASEFVAAFLGEERNLKRLALLTVADLGIAPGPVVGPDDAPEVAAQAAAAHRSDWVAVVRGDQLLGWVWLADLDGRRRVGDVPAHPFRSHVEPTTTLRNVLDGIVKSVTQVAVVVEDGQYRGMVTLDDLAGQVQS